MLKNMHERECKVEGMENKRINKHRFEISDATS